jgi:hypothetical protein
MKENFPHRKLFWIIFCFSRMAQLIVCNYRDLLQFHHIRERSTFILKYCKIESFDLINCRAEKETHVLRCKVGQFARHGKLFWMISNSRHWFASFVSEFLVDGNKDNSRLLSIDSCSLQILYNESLPTTSRWNLLRLTTSDRLRA